MKQLFTLFSFASMISGILAQPVIESADFIPVAGLSITSANSDMILPPGNEGAEQIWDFSQLTSSTTSEFVYQAVADQPGALQFPNSNFVLTDGKFTYQYFNINEDSASTDGVVSDFFGQVFSTVFTDPFVLLQFPMTFGDVYTDTYAYDDDSGNLLAEATLTHNVNGYGTLNLPMASIQDVLRIEREGDVIIYSYDPQGNEIGSDTLPTMQIDYMAPGFSYPLLTYTIQDGDSFISYMMNIATSTQDTESDASVGVFPNPVYNGYATVNSSIPIRSVAVFDLSGRMIRSYNPGGVETFRLDCTDLKSGIYLLKVMDDNVLRTVKFVVE